MKSSTERIVGYTTGVFDMFHIGHLRILELAKSQCDHLIVGVTADRLCVEKKQKSPIIPEWERMEIVKSVRHVDQVVIEDDLDKLKFWEQLRFNVIFKGNDWQGTELWNKLEQELSQRGVRTVFFPYTQHTSSTILRKAILNEINGSHRGERV